MALQKVNNVRISGIATCVPETVIDNRKLSLLGSQSDIDKFIETTGIAQRHVVGNKPICTSDLCYTAAEKIISDLNWNKEDIDCLVFVTQTPDYILPATSCILQDRLGLSKDCFSIDISMGCSGWVYGLSTISSLMCSGNFKKGLLLVGDTVTVTKSKKDKSTYPLFGDAGTATALEFSTSAQPMYFHTGTDGSGFESIIIEDGGFRNFFNSESLVEKERESGIFRTNLQSHLNGQDVFIFGITRAPKSVKTLMEHFALKNEDVDYFVFHQANKLMTEMIRKKIKIEPEKVPYSLDEFGNTSSASIPLTITTRLQNQVQKNQVRFLACGFGVGLSWGTVYFETANIVCSDLLYYKLNN
jgi:3-oxoacyl-[acyl-carrier-protein] synthase-3